MTIKSVLINVNEIYRKDEDNVFECKLFNSGEEPIDHVRIRATTKLRGGGKYEERSLGEEQHVSLGAKSISEIILFQEWYSEHPGKRIVTVMVEWRHDGMYKTGHAEVPIYILSGQEKRYSIKININNIRNLATAGDIVNMESLKAMDKKTDAEITKELRGQEQAWVPYPLKLDKKSYFTRFYLSKLDKNGNPQEILAVSTKDDTLFGRFGGGEPDIWIYPNKQSWTIGPGGKKHSFIGRRQFWIKRVKGGYEIHDVPTSGGTPRNQLNGDALAEPKLLKNNDTIQLHHEMSLRVVTKGDHLLLESEDDEISIYRYLLLKKPFKFYELEISPGSFKVAGEKYKLQEIIAQKDVTLAGSYRIEAQLSLRNKKPKDKVAELTQPFREERRKK